MAGRPHVLARFHWIADMMDQSLAAGCTADEAEARAIEQVRRLGQELLGDWAQEKQVASLERVRSQHSEAVKHIKRSKLAGSVWPGGRDRTLLRLGRGGAEFRPFCREARVKEHGYSLRLQRGRTDFGAEVSFGQAVSRVGEHNALDVPVEAVRQDPLRPGKAIATLAAADAAKPAKQVITQMEGSMIPVMQPGSGEDVRKGRSLFWREVRLCSARIEGQTTALYGASLGSAETAAWLWRAPAQSAGLGERTRVHGVGDGAPWIVDKFQENFGAQGRYLLDFYHLNEYLAAAAVIIKPKNPKRWRQRQQGRLLENKGSSVLRALQPHREAESAVAQPVNAAYQYLHKRRDHLDYAAARRQDLPLGSGEIERGHRHVIQQRLKLAGC